MVRPVLSFRNMTIKHFSIEYDAINRKNTFTNGDIINGRIIVEVSKQTKIQSLVFIAQGKAWVHCSDDGNEDYGAEENYYDIQEHILKASRQDGTEVISKGRHVFPFAFRIPDRSIPSSFKNSNGQIVHKVKAELKQWLKMTKKVNAHFIFVSKANMNIPRLMEPQCGFKDKTFIAFASGTVAMHVHTQRMGYEQGEALRVIVQIHNRSSSFVKPNIILYEKNSFFAHGAKRISKNVIHKENIDTVACFCNQTVTTVINIPTDLPSSILNCSIIKVEYNLGIQLDAKWASDLNITFPIVILPEFSLKQPSALSSFGSEATQQAWSNTPHPAAQPVDSPPSYDTYAMYPTVSDINTYSTIP